MDLKKKIGPVGTSLLGRSFLLLFFLLMSGCSNEEPAVTHLDDCYNHYKAESYLVATQSCELAAEDGEAQAQWLLGQIYRFALLKERDNPEEAIHWYLKAAEQGHVSAMREVGNAYLFGYGIEVDFDKAHLWLLRAAKKEDSVAAFSIGSLYFEGKGRTKDTGSAINWFKRAAVKKHAMGINNLAWIYATSLESAYNSPKKASYWLSKMDDKLFEIPMFLDTKAAVLAAQSEYKEAVSIQNIAISKLPEDIPESEMLEYQKHLERYLNNQPWKE